MGAVHPQVARAKYDREIAPLARDAARYRSLGVFLLAAERPTVLVGFAAPKLKPAPFIFAMQVDYTDYDLQAPSVRFVDPFTSVPYKASELPTKMLRTVGSPSVAEIPVPPGLPGPLAAAAPPGGNVAGAGGAASPALSFAGFTITQQQPLLQDYGPDEIPFLCLPGVREYHEHPGHSGDPWELHRLTGAGSHGGAGSLVRLVEVVRTYAVAPVAGWTVSLAPQVALGYGEPPP